MSVIIQSPHPTLRSIAAPVVSFKTKELERVIENMKTALNDEHDGVAIAAPQIGHSLRLFVVSKKVLPKHTEDTVFINPSIIRLGKKKQAMSEGCLSVRWKYGNVKRATSASVRAYTFEGNEFVMDGRNLLAQIFQHEIDHLNGVLFIDSATDIEDVPPEKSA